MTSILVKIERNSWHQLQCNFLKNLNVFLRILLQFWNLQKILNILKMNYPQNLNILEIIDSEIRGYVNA